MYSGTVRPSTRRAVADAMKDAPRVEMRVVLGGCDFGFSRGQGCLPGDETKEKRGGRWGVLVLSSVSGRGA